MSVIAKFIFPYRKLALFAGKLLRKKFDVIDSPKLKTAQTANNPKTLTFILRRFFKFFCLRFSSNTWQKNWRLIFCPKFSRYSQSIMWPLYRTLSTIHFGSTINYWIPISKRLKIHFLFQYSRSTCKLIGIFCVMECKLARTTSASLKTSANVKVLFFYVNITLSFNPRAARLSNDVHSLGSFDEMIHKVCVELEPCVEWMLRAHCETLDETALGWTVFLAPNFLLTNF